MSIHLNYFNYTFCFPVSNTVTQLTSFMSFTMCWKHDLGSKSKPSNIISFVRNSKINSFSEQCSNITFYTHYSLFTNRPCKIYKQELQLKTDLK